MPSRTAVLALAIGAATLAGGAGTAALAHPARATSPAHARVEAIAYATVNANGAIRWGSGIASVTRPSGGIYCVRANRADIRRTVPQGTAVNYGRVVSIIAEAHPQCGNRNDTYRVSVYNADTRRVADGAFHIVIVP